MKILYGVQGTGNGHISRASAMAEALQIHPSLDVTWLLSGRERDKGCGGITSYEWREGLTFVTRDGRVRMLDTLRKNNLRRFWRDVKALDLAPWDLVISDYEPVISHAARKQKIPVTGIGPQYALRYPIPFLGENPAVHVLMRYYAPADLPIGLHWHHFGNPILPPIIDMQVPETLPPGQRNKVIVYLPFENLARIRDLLRPHGDFTFYIYHPGSQDRDEGNLHLRAISRLGFKQDLLTAERVICNSGFELISECLTLGRQILTKPLQGQMEQLSNAAALEQLGYAQVIDQLDPAALRAWLHRHNPAPRMHYPQVAAALAAWIADGCRESIADMSARLWAETRELHTSA